MIGLFLTTNLNPYRLKLIFDGYDKHYKRFRMVQDNEFMGFAFIFENEISIQSESYFLDTPENLELVTSLIKKIS